MISDTKGMLKWPLIIAAILVVLRIILEQAGAPQGVSNISGVTWLYLIVPFYFAHRISAAQVERPYKSLFKSLFLFVTYTRLMIIPTYCLAYLLQWRSPRFLLTQGGNVGEGVSPFMGYLGIPFRNAVIWILLATAIGMLLGSILVALKRKANRATSTGPA